MDISVELTIQDLYRMLRHIRLGQRQFLDLVYRTFVLFFASMALVVARLSIMNPLLWLVLCLPGIYYFWGYPWQLTQEAKKLYKSKESLTQPIHYQLSEAGLSTQSSSGEELIEWGRFTRMMASKQDYIFYLAPTQAFIIPKRIFDEKQDREFMALLSQYMDPRQIFRY